MPTSVLQRLKIIFDADTKDAQSGMGKLRTEMTKTRSASAALAGAAGFGLVAKKVFEMGAAVEETQSKFDIVFGQSAASAQNFIDTFSTMAGLTKQEAQEIVATTGAIAQGMGFAEEASASFAEEAVRLAGDLGSFNNVPVAETARTIQSALTGERESLKQLGIVINQAEVDQRALALSGKESTKQLTAQDKATATLQIITERAGVAIGNLATEQSTAAGQGRAAASELKNIANAIALGLLPILAEGVKGIRAFVGGVQLMAGELALAFAGFEKFVADSKEENGFMRGVIEGIAAAHPALTGFIESLGIDLHKSAEQAAADLEVTEDAFSDLEAEIGNAAAAAAGFVGGLTGSGEEGGGEGAVAATAELTAQLEELIGVSTIYADRTLEMATFQEQMTAALEGTKIEIVDLTEREKELAADQARAAIAAEQHTEALGRQADQISETANAAIGLFNVFRSGGSFLSKIGGILGTVAPFLSLIPGLGTIASLGVGIAGKALSGFADGGTIPAGGVGVVGERGPELISPSASAMITPTGGGGGGDIHISLVMESGRQLVDTITVKQDRDRDVRRIIRVPVSAVAVG